MDGGYAGQRILDMELPDRRKRGIPQRRFMDVEKEDMQRDGRERVRQMIQYGHF